MLVSQLIYMSCTYWTDTSRPWFCC